MLGDVEAWVIDVSRFAGRPRLEVERDPRAIRVALRNARFPGTRLPADLECQCRAGFLGWDFRLKLAFGGFEAGGRFEPWLARKSDLTAPVRHDGLVVNRSLRDFGLTLAGPAEARFSPDWVLRLRGSGIVRLDVEGAELVSDLLSLALPEPSAPSGLEKPARLRTAITVLREGRRWRFWPAARAVEGGTLTTTDSPFDRVEIEAHEAMSGPVRVALLAAPEGDTERLVYQPGPGFADSEGHPLALPLARARYAGAFDAAGTQTALLASLGGEPCWLNAEGCMLQLGDAAGDTAFELLHKDGRHEALKLAPTVLASIVPLAGVVTEPTPPREPTRVTLAQARQAAPAVAGNCAAVEGCGGGAPEVCLPNFCLSILRPEDLLALCFEFRNLRLRTGPFRKPTLEVCDRTAEAYVIVHFPPQHIAEQAFLETLQDVQTEPPTEPPVQALLSGPSRLAFKLCPCEPREKGKEDPGSIPFDLDSLLDWDRFEPVLIDPARPLAKIEEPKDTETSIEVPYRLMMSPLKGSGSKWRHSARPVEHNGRTELWHTRLTSRPGETNKLVAVWSPDLRKDGTEPPSEYEPFRMSLSPLDRHQIVRLTHDKAVNPEPVQARLFMLSALGAWVDLEGRWEWQEERRAVPLERWKHVITMGRDQHVVIERRGFLYPCGHKATLVTETERKIQEIPPRKELPSQEGRVPAYVAYLKQRKYIRIKEPVKDYSNWDMAFRRLEFQEITSPPLDPIVGVAKNRCSTPPGPGDWGEKLFWPMVRGEAYRFPLKAIDYAANLVTLKMPFLFIEDRDKNFCLHPDDPEYVLENPDCQVTGFSLEELVREAACEYEQSGDRRRSDLQGQKVALGPSLRKGDTEIEAITVELQGCVADPADRCMPCRRDEKPTEVHPAPFWPKIEQIEGSVPAIAHSLGSGGTTWLKPLRLDCDPDAEIFAELVKKNSIQANFHENSRSSGGVVAPTPNITHLSRRFGPVGAAAASVPAAALNALPPPPKISVDQFFSDDAQLLGGIRLKDIVSLLDPNKPGSIPALLSVLTEYADGPDFLSQSIDWNTDQLQDIGLGSQSPLGFIARRGNANANFKIAGATEVWLGIEEPPTFRMEGTLTDFGLRLAFGGHGLQLNFEHVSYSTGSHQETRFDVKIANIEFLGALAFIQELEKFCKGLGDKTGIGVELHASGVLVRMPPITVPSIELGVFGLYDLTITNWCALPFTGGPVEIGFEFSRPDRPFLLSVGPFAGGGFIALTLDSQSQGIRSMAAALEFGAMKAISFGAVAHGRLYVMGGLYYGMEKAGDTKVITYRAYVRAGGELHALGIISICVDLYVGLEAKESAAESYLIGSVTYSASVKVGFIKKSFSITYTQRFSGSQRSTDRSSENLLDEGFSERILLVAADPQDSPKPVPKALRFTDVVNKDDWRCYWEAFYCD
jgi:hypothetical protein